MYFYVFITLSVYMCIVSDLEENKNYGWNSSILYKKNL